MVPIDRTEEFERAAAIIFNDRSGTTVKVVMRMAGFSVEEINLQKNQQAVRRMVMKKQQASVKSAPPVDFISVPSTASTSTPALSSLGSAHGSATTARSERSSKRNLDSLKKSSASLQTQVESEGMKNPPDTASNDNEERQIKRRRTVKRKQQDDATTERLKRVEDDAFKRATSLWHKELQKPKGEKRISSQDVVDRVNQQSQSSVSARRMRKYVNDGRVNESPDRRGRRARLPVDIMSALKWTFGN
jgi:hypothetical protein